MSANVDDLKLKVKELLMDAVNRSDERVDKLVASGALSMSDYNPNHWIEAKQVASAMMQQEMWSMEPPKICGAQQIKAFKSQVKNLFIFL